MKNKIWFKRRFISLTPCSVKGWIFSAIILLAGITAYEVVALVLNYVDRQDLDYAPPIAGSIVVMIGWGVAWAHSEPYI